MYPYANTHNFYCNNTNINTHSYCIPRLILILILVLVHAGVVASFPERAKEQLLRLNLDGPIEQVRIRVCVRS